MVVVSQNSSAFEFRGTSVHEFSRTVSLLQKYNMGICHFVVLSFVSQGFPGRYQALATPSLVQTLFPERIQVLAGVQGHCPQPALHRLLIFCLSKGALSPQEKQASPAH